MNAARLAYTALVHAALPFARLRLAWRARREPGYAEHISERFGRYAAEVPTAPLIWIHAVSVGETRAAEPLVRALGERYPGHRILLTHMTPTGRRTGAALYGERGLRCYLPYDYPAAVGRFLDHFRPRLGLIMETEIWPNLIAGCVARGVPLYLVNARLSEKSFRGYRRIARLARASLAGLSGIAAQSPRDAERFAALGAANITVTGNLKFDVTPAAAQIELGREWRAALGDRAVLLAASTRDGEEALLLDAFAELKAPRPLFLIVPRHLQRFDEVARLIESRGFTYARRSAGASAARDTEVMLGDSMGEMTAYYAACDVAFIGGSLGPFGGQNLIEACAVGKPVLIGPSTYNFADAAEGAIEYGAAVRVQTAEALMESASHLLADAPARLTMGKRAIAFSRVHQGASGRVLKLVQLERK
ncbi:MAG TPA: lipid IV(A) 3-deoxy-D-manno-octulosonic acid transferase [Burkholderiales bacterium]|nr:lipid IV(A) 3-deoxy-D-manno-octulosonic acid transferase [Burkholderiales bacterium]